MEAVVVDKFNISYYDGVVAVVAVGLEKEYVVFFCCFLFKNLAFKVN